ncbi:hypothetical protein ACM66B_004951 [Microbotryomycetes sp. NB124-2]
MADLPVELLPSIIGHLRLRRSDLRRCMLVNRVWSAVAERELYSWIRLWGKDLAIVEMLFLSLMNCPRRCKLIQTLEVRVFPLPFRAQERLDMQQLAINVLRQCENLKQLLWTRKGSLTDDVFDAITALPLDRFEFNGSTNLSPGSWSTEYMLQLHPLVSLSVIMPDRQVANALPQLLRIRNGQTRKDGKSLEHLTVLCRDSPNINDRIMSECAAHLEGTGLRSLALAGCSKLSGAPVLSLLPTLPSLQHLALEATNISAQYLTQFAPHLADILSLKLTHPGPGHAQELDFFAALATIFAHSRRLNAVTLYHSGSSGTQLRIWPILPQAFVEALASSVGSSLVKFEVSNILVPLDRLVQLCSILVNVRDLVVHAPFEAGPLLIEHVAVPLSQLCHLKTLHILSQYADITTDQVAWLASQCSVTLKQIGLRNRVWHVDRSQVVNTQTGESSTKTRRAGIRLVETAEAFGAFRRARYGAEEDAESGASSDEMDD